MHFSIIKNVLGNIILALFLGIVLIIVGYALEFGLLSVGFTSNVEGALIIAGIFCIIYSFYLILKIPFNPSIKCWKHYGDSDIDEIDDTINSDIKIENYWGGRVLEPSKAKIGGLMVTNSWIIDVTNYVFVKPEDVNWIYIKLIPGKNCYLNEITIFTNFSLKFSVALNAFCTQNELDTSENDAILKYNYLQTICPKAILGFDPKYEEVWKKSPENFVKNVKTK